MKILERKTTKTSKKGAPEAADGGRKVTFDTEPAIRDNMPAALNLGSGVPGGPSKLLLGQKLGGEPPGAPD